MAKRRGKKYKKKQKGLLGAIFGKSLALVMAFFVLLGVLFGILYDRVEPLRDIFDQLGIFSTAEPKDPPISPNGEELFLHYIDVGQGDSTLLQSASGSVLIDCGEKEYGDDVVKYLDSLGIDELEYFIITHPDSDHMGCASYILENVDVKYFVINGKVKTAKFFEDALDCVERYDIPLLEGGAGDVFEVGAIHIDILGPRVDDIEKLDSNDSSLILYVSYGEKRFLFTGDAEKEGEELLLKWNGNDIKCDIFSAGHHGAKTSNSLELMLKADPDYVVISCGAGNSYGHPTAQALSNFKACDATVLRTDELGTIVFVTDGNTLERDIR